MRPENDITGMRFGRFRMGKNPNRVMSEETAKKCRENAKRGREVVMSDRMKV